MNNCEQAIVYLHIWNIFPRKDICRVADQQGGLADGTSIYNEKEALVKRSRCDRTNKK